MFERFLGSNLRASEEKGTGDQRDDMAGLIAITSQVGGELEDQFRGLRKSADHPQHKPNDLVESFVDGVLNIVKLRREIDLKK